MQDKVLQSDLLTDPCNDRVMRDVQTVPHRELTRERVFFADSTSTAAVNTSLIKDWIRKGGLLSKDCLSELIARTKALLEREPNLIKVDGAVGVVGDIHGQLYDMFYMLD